MTREQTIAKARELGAEAAGGGSVNPLLTIVLRWTLAPIFQLMAWCLLVEQQVGDVDA
jgi:hypothetical protein